MNRLSYLGGPTLYSLYQKTLGNRPPGLESVCTQPSAWNLGRHMWSTIHEQIPDVAHQCQVLMLQKLSPDGGVQKKSAYPQVIIHL